MRARVRRHRWGCQRSWSASARPVASTSRPAFHCATRSGRRTEYRSKRSARRRALPNQVAPGGRIVSGPRRSSSFPVCSTSSTAQTRCSTCQGSVVPSALPAPRTAWRSASGKVNVMLAATPSPAWGSDAPSDLASSRASHRCMPTVGTATHSEVIGSASGSASTSARVAASGPASLALESWSTDEDYPGGVTLILGASSGKGDPTNPAMTREDLSTTHRAFFRKARDREAPDHGTSHQIGGSEPSARTAHGRGLRTPWAEVCIRPNRGWPGSKEFFKDNVCQAPSGNRFWCDHHPDFVDVLLPGQRHVAIDPPHQLGTAVHFDLFGSATNEDAPSRATGVVDVIDLEGDTVVPQTAHFGPILRAEHDVLASDGIVDWNGCWPQVVRIDEPAEGLWPGQHEPLVPGQVLGCAPGQGESIGACRANPKSPVLGRVLHA